MTFGPCGDATIKERHYEFRVIFAADATSQEIVMSKPILVVLTILLSYFLVGGEMALGQSKEEGIKIFNEGKALQDETKSIANLKKAAEKYQLAGKIFEKAKFDKGTAAVDNNLGMVYAKLGEYSKAVDYCERALTIFRKLGDTENEFNTLTGLGNIYKGCRQYAKAVEHYEKALAIATKYNNLSAKRESLTNLGNAYEHWGEYSKAVEHYQQALKIAEKLGDREGTGTILFNLGFVYEAWRQYSTAVECYEKALAVKTKAGDRLAEGQIFNQLGNIYKDWGQYSTAVNYYEKALEKANKLHDREGEGIIRSNLGNVYYYWRQYHKAVEHYKKALDIARSIGDEGTIGGCFNNLGTVYKDLDQPSKAADYFEKALEIWRKTGYSLGQAEALMNLGVIHKDDWGRYSKAVEYYRESLKIFTDVKDTNYAGEALMNLGHVYKDWGQYSKAMDYYKKSLETFKTTGVLRDEGTARASLADVYAIRGQYSKAIEGYQRSLKIFKKLKDTKFEGGVLGGLGDVYAQEGEYVNALENYKAALVKWKEAGIPASTPETRIGDLYLDMGDAAKAEPILKESRSNLSLGRLYLSKSDYQAAKNCYAEVLKYAEERGNVDGLFTGYTGLGTVFERMGDVSGARDSYVKATKLTEELRAVLSRAERERFFDVRINGFYRTAPYKGLARVLLRMNKALDAFKNSEYTKARTFADAISIFYQEKRFGVPPEILKQDNDLNDQVAARKRARQKAYEQDNKQAITTLEPQIRQLENELAAHIRLLRDQYPLFAATKYPEPMDIDQTALKDDEWVLTYDVTDSGIMIYLTRGKRLVKGLFKPVSDRQLKELVDKFRQPMELGPDDSLAKKLASFDFKSGKKLSDLLLSDILSDLPKDTPVIIVPDGSLGVVPFEMLVLNDGGKVVTNGKRPQTLGAEFFGDRNPISYYQSITALTLARTLGKQQKPGEKLLAMVDPVFSSDDPRLVKLAKQEKNRLLATLPKDLTMSIETESGITFRRLPLTAQLGESLKKSDPSKTDLYEGMTAKKSLLLGKDLTPYRSLVFGTHGYFGKDLPGIQEPVLVLSLVGEPKGQDGFLRLSEVMGLKINCDIAALTACQTGLGRRISGEGTMGMGRAFQYAGAKSVLMSLWSVSETASVNLVESFFKHLKEGKNKLEALRLARDEIRKAGYDHPFYWAPFILVGEVN